MRDFINAKLSKQNVGVWRCFHIAWLAAVAIWGEPAANGWPGPIAKGMIALKGWDRAKVIAADTFMGRRIRSKGVKVALDFLTADTPETRAVRCI